MLIPTREIEFIWQSHMIRSQMYDQDCKNLRAELSCCRDDSPLLVDHYMEAILDALAQDDVAGEYSVLPLWLSVCSLHIKVFAQTAELWEREYHRPYILSR